MREDSRDLYTSPPLPRERSGPLLRFAIVVALLGASVWAYMTYAQGPDLTQAATEAVPAAVADASSARGYAIPPTAIPQTTPPEAESPSAMSAPAAPAEPLPPPTTGTIPPG